jgi:hypothetical protein
MADVSLPTSHTDSSQHKLRLQVFSLRQELKHLREELVETKRLATEALIEVKSLKNSTLVTLLAPPLPQPYTPSSTPDDYPQERAEKIVEQLFTGIDTAFGRPRGM